MSTNSYSLNGLKRWSCSDNELPSVDKIKSIHVYDFDNTLFQSPLPNRQLWQGPTIGFLQNQDTIVGGGWWHDPNILKCTGEGIEVEEPRAWRGWWNEQIVDLVGLSMQQKDAVSVLLTGRTEKGFADVIRRMVKSKKLKFDMIVLRPEVGPANEKFGSTMKFKQAFLESLVRTYREADDIRIYEDRVRHVQGFRDFFVQMNHNFVSETSNVTRKPIQTEVVPVLEKSTTLDPTTECTEVQKAIDAHNLAFREGSLPGTSRSYEIKKTTIFTGYIISPKDTERLLQIAGFPTEGSTSSSDDTRTLANSILIATRSCPPQILKKAGGTGKKLRWRAIALGDHEKKIFAAKVEPVPSSEPYYIAGSIPMVVLALRGNGRPADSNLINNWAPLPDEKAIEFDTVVNEKALLRIEPERLVQQESNRGFKRQLPQDEEFPSLGLSQPSHSQPRPNPPKGQPVQSQKRSYYAGENRRSNGNPSQDGYRGGQRFTGGRGVGGAGSGQRNSNFQRGRDGGGDGRGRGRAGYPGYRSLDDEARRNRNAFGTDGANDEGLSY